MTKEQEILNTPITFNLTVAQLQLLYAVLYKAQYSEVTGLIDMLDAQVAPQIDIVKEKVAELAKNDIKDVKCSNCNDDGCSACK